MCLSVDSRHKILNTMIEKRQNLESFFENNTIENQNRILRQINDFILVLSQILCKHVNIKVSLIHSIS